VRRPNRDPEEKRRVAETLRSLRVSADMTQEDAARRVGLTLSGYRTYEQSKRTLRAEQIPQFADAFGVAPTAITSRLWPDDAASDDAGALAERLYAAGVSRDRAPLVEKLVLDLARRTPRQQDQLIEMWVRMLELAGT
jgi:transcriptional regulator with XRE-family HTH domain